MAVDGLEQTRDLIVLPDRVLTNWWRRDGHSLVLEDLAEVLDELPERLTVGIGARGCRGGGSPAPARRAGFAPIRPPSPSWSGEASPSSACLPTPRFAGTANSTIGVPPLPYT